MYSVLKPYHKAGKKLIKGQKKAAKPRSEKTTLKDAVFMVIPEAKEGVSSNGSLPYSARRLLYRV